MTTPDVEDYLSMTSEQRQDWYRNYKRDTQSLAETCTHLLRAVWDQHVPKHHRQESGLYNCHGWMMDALRNNNVPRTISKRRGRRMANLCFILHGGTVELVEQDIMLDTGNDRDPHTPKEIKPKYMGTMVELALWGSAPGHHYRLFVRWLAYNSELSQKGLLVDDYHSGAWRFPYHTWCDFEGKHEQAANWLTLADQTLTV